MCYNLKEFIIEKNNEEDIENEAREDIKRKYSEEQHEERRMRRVPDILSVCMQDFLHSRKSELRESESLRISDR